MSCESRTDFQRGAQLTTTLAGVMTERLAVSVNNHIMIDIGPQLPYAYVRLGSNKQNVICNIRVCMTTGNLVKTVSNHSVPIVNFGLMCLSKPLAACK